MIVIPTVPCDVPSWWFRYKEIVVAAIAVFGTALTVVLPLVYQKDKELKLKVAEQKREAYGNFLKNFTETAVDIAHNEYVEGKETDRARVFSRNQLLLYGSDDVVKAYDAWIRYADTDGHDTKKEGQMISLIFLAIRKDLLGKTKVTGDHLENLNPFNRG